jgi:TolB-like protein
MRTDRLRVNAQLIDAESGAYLWAERFDKPRADLFDMQDEITARCRGCTISSMSYKEFASAHFG